MPDPIDADNHSKEQDENSPSTRRSSAPIQPWKRPLSQAPSTSDSQIDHIYDLYAADNRRSIPPTPNRQSRTNLTNGEENDGMGKILRSNTAASQHQIITRSGSHRLSKDTLKTRIDPDPESGPEPEPEAELGTVSLPKNRNKLPPPSSWDTEDSGLSCASILSRHGKKMAISLATLLLISIILIFFLFPRSISITVMDIKPAGQEQYKFYTANGKMGILSDSHFVCRVTNSNYLPLRIRQASIHAYWVVSDSERVFFGNGSMEDARVAPRSFNEVKVPLMIDYMGDPRSDAIFQDYLGRCAGPEKRSVELQLALNFRLRNGAVGVQRSFNYTLRWPCQAELSVENLAAILDASGFPQDSVRVKQLANKSIKDLVNDNKRTK